MRSQLWTERDAQHYDHNHRDRFDPAVLRPTVDLLAGLATEAALTAAIGGVLDGAAADHQRARALELAIGTGRVAVPLHERGVAVAGIELSEPMVAKLRDKVAADEIPVTIGDMSTATAPPPGPAGFHLVYLVYNTITNLLTQDAQVDCFVNAARHLTSGGYFVIENVVPDLRRLPVGQAAVPCTVTDDHLNLDTFDTVSQRLTSHHFRRRAGDDGGDGTWSRTASEHRYCWPAELDLMARIAGLEPAQRMADWDGSPFDQSSPSGCLGLETGGLTFGHERPNHRGTRRRRRRCPPHPSRQDEALSIRRCSPR